ncbi:hypothetical protein BKA64DRAFT_149709 [Cadophora sp. MPI-SDFR-AT-0126]|nr:hypothetical protein BKA64DRAFT_149709 [Leotiomycetes sp. MPI-SDFR-AT-0126]
MAPSTRFTKRPSTPEYQSHVGEYNTIEKTRFFNAYDREYPGKSIPVLALESGTSEPTAKRWLAAYRHTRKRSKILGKQSRVSKEQCERLVSPSNPVRDQHLEAQIDHFNIEVKPRQLKKMLKVHTKNGRRFKQAYVKKEISPANKAKRVAYGKEH